jgi:uncharacterized protein
LAESHITYIETYCLPNQIRLSKIDNERSVLMTREQLKNGILPLLERYGVRRASLFGSVARGDDNPASDIDILVEMPDSASLLELAGLKVDLEELLNRVVDILTYDSLHPLLRDRILGEQVSIL